MESTSLKSYFKDLRQIDVLDTDVQTEMAIKAQKGNVKAKNELIEGNLRFVVSVAREYEYSGMPLEDLINEGNLGLIRAIDKFDASKGYKFISYAVWWIRQAIRQALYDHGSVVRFPVNRINLSSKIVKAKDTLSKQLDRDPSNREIAIFLEVKESDVSELNTSSQDVYFDSFVSDDSEAKNIDFMQSEGLEQLEVKSNSESLRDELFSVLSSLTERERIILNLYYGLTGECEKTLGEIGDQLGLTNERVRQIKEFALKKLRMYNNSSKLREFLNYNLG